MSAPQDLARLMGLEGSIYGQKLHLRQHDLMVRERAGSAVLAGAAALRGLAVRYRAERIPPSTRAQPYPPQDAMAVLRRLEQAQARLEALSDDIRNLTLPAEDLVWERMRSGSLQLELLAEVDLQLIGLADTLRDWAEGVDLATADAPSALDGLASAARGLRDALRRRADLLAIGG